MSNHSRARRISSQQQGIIIDLTRDSDAPIHAMKTPRRPTPSTFSSNSTTSSASSAGSVFDENVPDTPVTPGTPIDEQLEFPRSEGDVSAETPSSPKLLAQQSESSFRNKLPKKGRGPVRGTAQHTGSPLEKTRQQTRSASNGLHSDHIFSSSLSRIPSGRQRSASAAVLAPKTPPKQHGTSTSYDNNPPLSGAFESQSIHTDVEPHTRENGPDNAQASTSAAQVEIKTAAPGAPDHRGSEISERSDYQRPIFENYRGENKPALMDRAINTKIYNCLKKKRDPKDPKKNIGYIYLFNSFECAPGHIKIGKTEAEPGNRKTQLEKCKMKLSELEDDDRNAFDYFFLVESLLMAELHNCRKKFKCSASPCSTHHQEWYEIDAETALKHVSKWRTWVKRKPFDKDGNFTPYWQWRFDRLSRKLDKVDWDSWTNPGFFDCRMYQKTSGNKCVAELIRRTAQKDRQFFSVGTVILLILYMNFGTLGVICGVVGLIAL